jgi:hypothetical protein
MMLKKLWCQLFGHRWFHGVLERRVFYEQTLHDFQIFDAWWQNKICTRCWTAKADLEEHHYIGGGMDLADDTLKTPDGKMPESWPDPDLEELRFYT